MVDHEPRATEHKRPPHKQLLVMHRTNLRYLVLLGLRCTDQATQFSQRYQIWGIIKPHGSGRF